MMYGEDDERGKSTVWQGDGARLLAVLLGFSGKLMCTHITGINITHPCFFVLSWKTTSCWFSINFEMHDVLMFANF